MTDEDKNAEIDRQNAHSYWYVYAAVFIQYIAFGIWYGFTIKNATNDGARTNALGLKC